MFDGRNWRYYGGMQNWDLMDRWNLSFDGWMQFWIWWSDAIWDLIEGCNLRFGGRRQFEIWWMAEIWHLTFGLKNWHENGMTFTYCMRCCYRLETFCKANSITFLQSPAKELLCIYQNSIFTMYSTGKQVCWLAM